jgi:2'-5' RNA ligase
MSARMYYLAQVLPRELNEKILPLKKWMQETWGCRVALKSPAHITLVPPGWVEADRERELIAATEALAGGSTPFDLKTTGFAAFPPRTLFIAIEKSAPLEKLKAAADAYFHLHTGLLKGDPRRFHPHITIATRDISKAAFHEAWSELEGKPFSETWRADTLSLLRHTGAAWEVIHQGVMRGVP